MRSLWTRGATAILGSLAMMSFVSRPAPAQTAPAADSTSTLAGVYTTEQANRGRRVYSGLCKSCHTPSTGSSFARLWAGRPVSELFSYIMQTMPDNNPGQLSATDNADIVGYLLQMTGMPAGSRELSPVVDSLKTIRIEMKRDTLPPASGALPRSGRLLRKF